MSGLLATSRAGGAPTGLPSPEEESKEDREHFEAEFVASDIFRSGSLVLTSRPSDSPSKDTTLEAKKPIPDIQVSVGLGPRKALKLAPGFGVVFGSNEFTTSPAFSFRWEYERKWFITQGLVVQSFRDTPIFEEESEAE